MNMLTLLSTLAAVCTPGTGTIPHNVPTFVFSLGKILFRIVIVVLLLCAVGYLIGRFANRNAIAEDFKLWARKIIIVTLHAILLWIGLSMLMGYLDSSVIDTVFGGIILAGFLITSWSRVSEGPSSSSSLLMAVYLLVLIMAVWGFVAPRVAPDLSTDFIPKFFFDALYPSSPFC